MSYYLNVLCSLFNSNSKNVAAILNNVSNINIISDIKDFVSKNHTNKARPPLPHYQASDSYLKEWITIELKKGKLAAFSPPPPLRHYRKRSEDVETMNEADFIGKGIGKKGGELEVFDEEDSDSEEEKKQREELLRKRDEEKQIIKARSTPTPTPPAHTPPQSSTPRTHSAPSPIPSNAPIAPKPKKFSSDSASASEAEDGEEEEEELDIPAILQTKRAQKKPRSSVSSAAAASKKPTASGKPPLPKPSSSSSTSSKLSPLFSSISASISAAISGDSKKPASAGGGRSGNHSRQSSMSAPESEATNEEKVEAETALLIMLSKVTGASKSSLLSGGSKGGSTPSPSPSLPPTSPPDNWEVDVGENLSEEDLLRCKRIFSTNYGRAALPSSLNKVRNRYGLRLHPRALKRLGEFLLLFLDAAYAAMHVQPVNTVIIMAHSFFFQENQSTPIKVPPSTPAPATSTPSTSGPSSSPPPSTSSSITLTPEKSVNQQNPPTGSTGKMSRSPSATSSPASTPPPSRVYLLVFIRSHSIFSDMRFWESLFFESYSAALSSSNHNNNNNNKNLSAAGGGGGDRSKKSGWSGLSSFVSKLSSTILGEDEEHRYAQRQLLFSTISTLITNMKHFGVNDGKIRSLIVKLSEINQLSDEQQRQVLKMCENKPINNNNNNNNSNNNRNASAAANKSSSNKSNPPPSSSISSTNTPNKSAVSGNKGKVESDIDDDEEEMILAPPSPALSSDTLPISSLVYDGPTDAGDERGLGEKSEGNDDDREESAQGLP